MQNDELTPAQRELLESRRRLMDEVRTRFDIWMVCYYLWPSDESPYRGDVTSHGFSESEGILADDLRNQIRLWIEAKNLQWSRQLVRLPGTMDFQERIYIGNIHPITLPFGYHATRRSSVDAIFRDGLLASVPERQVSESRLDCEGNIYVVGKLGVPQDAGNREAYSAHWWRDHLSRNNRFNDPDWVILEIDLRQGLENALICKDIWSVSGIVISGVDRIARERIRIVYP